MKRINKQFIVIIILSLLAVVMIAAVPIFLLPSIDLKNDNKIFERGEIYNPLDFIIETNGELIIDKELFDTDEVGKFKYVYNVKKNGITRKFNFDYEVVDTVGPKIEFIKDVVVKDPGDEYSLDEIRKNIIINEGTYEIETDYDPYISGDYLITIKAKDDYGNTSEASYKITIMDHEAPTVFRNGNNTKILKGEEFDIMEIISYGDNADPNPKLKVDGNVDINEIGRYPLHVTLTDSSNNEVDWYLTVEVVEEMEEVEPRHISYPFEEFVQDYYAEGRKFGIDVSSWQGDIDYDEAKKAGLDFVIIRIGFCYKGELTIDKKYKDNLKGAKEAGLPIGIYLFCYENNEEDLLISMEKMFDELGDVELELPIVFDWEDFGNYQHYNMSFQMLNNLYDVFEKEVNNRGYKSMLYASKHYLDLVWTKKDTRPIWLAQYINKPTYEGPYQIWQVSESGSLPGANERVDFDIMFN